jgi:hypothetical protein
MVNHDGVAEIREKPPPRLAGLCVLSGIAEIPPEVAHPQPCQTIVAGVGSNQRPAGPFPLHGILGLQ